MTEPDPQAQPPAPPTSGRLPARPTTGALRSVAALSGGTAVAQILAIATSPILSRLYGPEAFGPAAAFASTATVLLIFAALRTEVALFLPRDDQDAVNLVAVGVVSAAATGVLLLIVAVALLPFLPGTLLPALALVLPLHIAFGGAAAPLRAWNARLNRFPRLGINRVVSGSAVVGSTLTFGWLFAGAPLALVVGRLFQPAVDLLQLGIAFLREDLAFAIKAVSPAAMRAALFRYRRFPLLEGWGAFLSAVSLEIPVILLLRFFGDVVAGLYALAILPLMIPTRFLGESIAQVFFQRMSARRNEGLPLGPPVEDVVIRLMGMGLLPLGVIALAGPELFAFVFGERWRGAGEFAALLSPFLFVFLVVSPLASLLDTLERQKLGLIYTVALMAARIGGLAIGGLVFRDPLVAIVIYSAVGATFNALLGSWLCRLTGARFAVLGGALATHVFSAAPVLAGVVAIGLFVPNPGFWQLLTATAGIVAVAIITLRRDPVLAPRLGLRPRAAESTP